MNQSAAGSSASPPTAAPPGSLGQHDLTPLLLVLAGSILLLQRFWLFGKVPWIMPIVALALLTAYRQGSVVLQRDRLISFLALGGLALLATLIHGCLGDVFSMRSIVYLLAIYCLFVVTPTAPRDQARLLRVWQALSFLCALLGILQFALFLATQQVFDVMELLPRFVADNPGYNTIDFDPAHTFLRANGMIFLEPSTYSQLMALALVIEAAFFKSPYRLCGFLTALVCALSGTGILMLGTALLVGVMMHPVSLLQRRAVIGLGFVALAALLIMLLAPALHQYFAARAADSLSFEARDSSFYVRFIAPWVAVYRLCRMGLRTTLLGLGPGLFNVTHLQMRFSPNLNPISQVAVYYGILTALAFVVFLLRVSMRRYSQAQWVVMLTVLFQYLFCSGSLLEPTVTCVLLWFTLVFGASEAAPAKVHA